MGRDLLFQSGETQVYRVSGSRRRGSVIVKMTQARRVEQQLHAQSVLHGLSFVPAPAILFSRVREGNGLIVFADEGLEPVLWTTDLGLNAVKMLAAIHRLARPGGNRPGVSHTPGFEQIVKEVQTQPLEYWIERLSWDGLPVDEQRKVYDLWHTAASLIDLTRSVPAVWSHGDAHCGNFLWNPGSQTLALIDWEYAHFDLPFFDLYQLLDATSPIQPLVRPTERTAALQAYWSAVESPLSWYDFEGLYRGFAFWHHLWILGRIETDEQAKRFPLEGLLRQRQETIQGITELLSG